MGFVKDVARAGTFGILGQQLAKKKPKQGEITMRPSMISTTPAERPISMIGTRGGY